MAYQQPGGISPGGAAGALDQHGPQGAEYTLQGVMRFLQTEWHRHERDRNAWEIEKQEMKGRIASLEGQARRADATQKALRKYVSILERKVKDQAAQLKGTAAPDLDKAARNDRAAKIQEKLRCKMHPLLDHVSRQMLTLPQRRPRSSPYLAPTASRLNDEKTSPSDTSSRRSSISASPNLCT